MAKQRAVSALGAIGVALVLSGCWTQIGFGSERQRFNPDEASLTAANVASLRQQWAVDLPTDDEPIVSDGKVFVGYGTETTYGVRAVELATGRTAWDRSLITADPSFSLNTAPVAIASGQLWASYGARSTTLGQCGGVQLKYDPANGSGDPANREGGVLGYPSVESGGSLAQVRTEYPSSPGCGPETTALVVTPSSGSKWSHSFDSADPLGLPVIAGDQVFIARGSEVLAFELGGCGQATCEPTWRVQLGGLTVRRVVAGAGDKVFAVVPYRDSRHTDVVALDRTDGSEEWSADLRAESGRVAVAGDLVYVTASGFGDGGNTLQAFRASGCGSSTCSPVWSAQLGGTAVLGEGPVVAGGVVYAGRAGGVVAFRASGCGASNCSPIVSVGVGGDPRGMSVSDGRLFVTTGARLVALAPRTSS